MIDIPLIDELREVRRRLSEEQGNDPHRYAAMLRGTSEESPGTYVTHPVRVEEADASPPPASS